MYQVNIVKEAFGVRSDDSFIRRIPCTRSAMRNILWRFFVKSGVVNVFIVDTQTGEITADIQPNGEMYFSSLCREV